MRMISTFPLHTMKQTTQKMILFCRFGHPRRFNAPAAGQGCSVFTVTPWLDHLRMYR